jgi:hypothetical protein
LTKSAFDGRLAAVERGFVDLPFGRGVAFARRLSIFVVCLKF